MWTLFEPIHAVTYFTPEARAAFEAANLRGFWRGYFAGRAAPLGAVGAAPVEALFFGFAPGMVARALPDVWSRATPAEALAARLAGARSALSSLLAEAGPIDEAAELLRAAASAVPTSGRALGAANAALPWPDDALGVLWQAATILREHRGDGHVAALLVAGLDGGECAVWRTAIDQRREYLQPARGWTDDDWSAAADRLRDRGWLDESGATKVALDARDEIEAITDRLAAAPWESLGEARTARLREVLRPLAVRARSALPAETPIGLPTLK
ncbi:hypothetical protein O7635_16420 [Asanoa sp. WMMD1127]|uniref:SCO6745 family protein n=1 Tax=Asanoa sp. WMMD1127 TaxID=3016107 RepID=UPI002416D25A|nr:hypothetical protein [Asanoa sp. WMMD1127]MDG4823443.1 hypothetical protein [Asanoa sp. WMMD1127]